MELKKGDYVNVVATVNLSAKTAKIQFVNPVTACMQPTEESKTDFEARESLLVRGVSTNGFESNISEPKSIWFGAHGLNRSPP